MFDAARRVLGIPRGKRVHFPDGKPTFVAHRKGEEWGVSVLHGGRELFWYRPEDARREAINLINLAEIAANPGYLPAEQFG